jgi:hypothetical protein
MYLYSAAHASHSRSVWALLLSALVLFPAVVLGSTPNTIFSVQGVAETWLVKRGEFGSEADTVTGRLLQTPEYDLYLCEYFNTNRAEPLLPVFPSEDIILAVPRGLCTFEKKAFAAHRMYGATGLLVYDNLSARYRWNTTTERVEYPADELDYECDNGYSVVYNLTLDPPFYDGGALDHLLDMTNPSTLCNLQETRTPCESQLCVVTKHEQNATEYPVCCAWDTLITMQPDAEGAGDTSMIVPVMMTIRQSQEIFTHVGQIVTLTARPYTAFNASIILVWTVGVLITGLACWYAAQDYRIFRAKLARFQDNRRDLEQQQQQQQQQQYGATEDDQVAPKEADESDAFIVTLDDDDDGDEEEPDIFVDEEDVIVEEDKKKDDKKKKRWALHSLPPAPKEKNKAGETKKGRDDSDVWVLHSLPPPERKRKSAEESTSQAAKSSAQPSSDPLPEPWSSKMASTEMTQWHVLGFLVSASLMLFLLFYFKFFALITILYGTCMARPGSRNNVPSCDDTHLLIHCLYDYNRHWMCGGSFTSDLWSNCCTSSPKISWRRMGQGAEQECCNVFEWLRRHQSTVGLSLGDCLAVVWLDTLPTLPELVFLDHHRHFRRLLLCPRADFAQTVKHQDCNDVDGGHLLL